MNRLDGAINNKDLTSVKTNRLQVIENASRDCGRKTMCDRKSKGPNIDFDQVDIPEFPPPPKPVIDWNDKTCRYKCSFCKKRKMFPQGPILRDAGNDFQIVCSDCAGKYVASGLDALLSLGRVAMNDHRSTIWVLDGLSLHLKEYREAVELEEQL